MSRQKQRERSQHAVDEAQSALGKAEQEYTRRAAALRFEIEPIEEKLSAEEADWDKERQRLKAALRRTAESRIVRVTLARLHCRATSPALHSPLRGQ